LVLGGVTYGGLVILLLLRLVERPLFGLQRPITPWITQFVCRSAFRIMGMGFSVRGTPMRQPGAVVANHASWLDIFTLNAPQRCYFVSKSEVAGWPGIGWLARATGTVFIQRKGSQALAQKMLFEARLRAGHRLVFFPEGTSTDGLRVLPFKSTLFAAFFADGLDAVLWVQPVSLVYTAPDGEDARFYGWWGEMDFGTHLLKTLAARRQGGVEVVFTTLCAWPISPTARHWRRIAKRPCAARSGALPRPFCDPDGPPAGLGPGTAQGAVLPPAGVFGKG
jgi:1-acyl-sn-glycerol-3-phosphate acyltransferase